MASAKRTAEEKKMTGFICHDQYLEKTRRLSDQELGQLIRACMKYHSTGEIVELSERLSMAFDFIRDDIDCAEDSYMKRCEQNKKNREKKPEEDETKELAESEPVSIDDDRKQPLTVVGDREQPSTIVDNKNKEKEIKENIKKANKEKELKEKDDRFDLFWTAYPRHDSKENARKAFDKLNPDDSLMDTILLAIARQKESPQWQENGGQFIPYPASWLNGKRWQDEMKPRPTGTGKPVQAQDYEQREYGGTTDDARRRMLAMLDGEIDV